MFSLEEGIKAVEHARNIIESSAKGEKYKYTVKELGEKFNDKYGVFVTIETYPDRKLRGCIGYPEPTLPLIDALTDSARNATRDPRFEPLCADELDKVVIEVSLLTKPELIVVKHPVEYKEKIKIGKDGLIAEKSLFRGLLLPQVAVEWMWDEEEFLTHTCIKAGLLPDDWLSGNVKIYKFQAQIFSELAPRGKIVARALEEEA